jgi:hypothetical protein
MGVPRYPARGHPVLYAPPLQGATSLICTPHARGHQSYMHPPCKGPPVLYAPPMQGATSLICTPPCSNPPATPKGLLGTPIFIYPPPGGTPIWVAPLWPCHKPQSPGGLIPLGLQQTFWGWSSMQSIEDWGYYAAFCNKICGMQTELC